MAGLLALLRVSVGRLAGAEAEWDTTGLRTRMFFFLLDGKTLDQLAENDGVRSVHGHGLAVHVQPNFYFSRQVQPNSQRPGKPNTFRGPCFLAHFFSNRSSIPIWRELAADFPPRRSPKPWTSLAAGFLIGCLRTHAVVRTAKTQTRPRTALRDKEVVSKVRARAGPIAGTV